MLTNMLPSSHFTIKLDKKIVNILNFLAQNLSKPFNRRTMDWAGLIIIKFSSHVLINKNKVKFYNI